MVSESSCTISLVFCLRVREARHLATVTRRTKRHKLHHGSSSCDFPICGGGGFPAKLPGCGDRKMCNILLSYPPFLFLGFPPPKSCIQPTSKLHHSSCVSLLLSPNFLCLHLYGAERRSKEPTAGNYFYSAPLAWMIIMVIAPPCLFQAWGQLRP